MKPEQRREVVWFADHMERKLRDNDHKGGWSDSDPFLLLEHLKEEVDELDEAVESYMQDPYKNLELMNRVIDEAADVGNMAMMVADVMNKQVAVTGSSKLYPHVDAESLDRDGGYFLRHLQAMTAEQLYSKADIAVQLGARDMKIDKLTLELEKLRGKAHGETEG
jgi:NTP pyrophosphatase (non-canonical NTP hydrolase)